MPTGAAIVLPLPALVAAAVAVEDGVSAGELHLTLAYLPTFDREDEVLFGTLRDVVSTWAAATPPIAAKLAGVGRFTLPDEDAFYASVDAPGLGAHRESLVTALAAAGFEADAAHGFTPHVTLAYLGADEAAPVERAEVVEVTFDAASIWRGDAHHDLLLGPAEEATTTEELAMPRRTRGRAPKPTDPASLSYERDGKVVRGAHRIGNFVPFAAPANTTEDGWTVLAYEVAMKGSDVALTRRDFEDCVKNFKAYPCAPITIEHADTDWSPFTQPPRQWREPNGHVEELRVGTYTLDGKAVASLEGRNTYLEPTASDVKARKWRFGSITIIQGAVSEETNEPLGSMLWSWSLTAHPRLTRLPAIAASMRPREGATELVTAGYWYGDIDDRDDLVDCLKTLLDLPTITTEAEVLAEVDKLERLIGLPADQREGIDVDCIIGRLRDALRLPALSSATEVIAEVRKGLAVLPSDDAPATTTSTAAATAPAASPRHNPSIPENHNMFKLLQFAATLGLAAASEEEAEKKVAVAATLGTEALKGLGLPLTADAEAFATKLKGLKDDAALRPVHEAELATFRAERDARVAADRAAHIDDVIALRPELAAVKDSLALHAQHDYAGFSAKHPRPTRAELTAASAESAQRAQDPARHASVTVTAANPATKDAPKPAVPPPAPGDRIAAFAAVLDDYGFLTDAATIADAVAKGHTPETLAAALARASA
jgi:2'-5' RNA ligase